MAACRVRVLRWRGIPAQVKVVPDGARAVSRQLDERWQREIDRVAMREGLVGTDAYLEGWTWAEEEAREGDPAEIAADVVAELEATWGAVDGR
ncbi:MAG: hypothetical protein FJW96_02830 [Actinobacteria bacterium]|nr:hypothetical protein [Actinomycetota bacterium]